MDVEPPVFGFCSKTFVEPSTIIFEARLSDRPVGRGCNPSDQSRGWVTRLFTDNSVCGVGELRCAGRFRPGRRECSERVCESLDGPMGDGIQEVERAVGNYATIGVARIFGTFC